MKQKTFRASIELKADGEPGEFRATFATFNVVDKDDDLTLPGAFPVGSEVVIEPWNHDWTLPVGKGQIGADQEGVGGWALSWTASTGTTRRSRPGALTEWSYTFWILDAASEIRDEKRIRILKKLDVAGVGPVTRGAGVGTRTERIKSAGGTQEGAGASDTDGDDEGQDGGAPVAPSGPPPPVVTTQIDLDLLEV